MRKVFIALVLVAGVAIVAGTTPASNFDPQRTAPLARAIMEGVILGSTPWPSTPLMFRQDCSSGPLGVMWPGAALRH
jgi:hypothetical protein